MKDKKVHAIIAIVVMIAVATVVLVFLYNKPTAKEEKEKIPEAPVEVVEEWEVNDNFGEVIVDSNED